MEPVAVGRLEKRKRRAAAAHLRRGRGSLSQPGLRAHHGEPDRRSGGRGAGDVLQPFPEQERRAAADDHRGPRRHRADAQGRARGRGVDPRAPDRLRRPRGGADRRDAGPRARRAAGAGANRIQAGQAASLRRAHPRALRRDAARGTGAGRRAPRPGRRVPGGDGGRHPQRRDHQLARQPRLPDRAPAAPGGPVRLGGDPRGAALDRGASPAGRIQGPEPGRELSPDQQLASTIVTPPGSRAPHRAGTPRASARSRARTRRPAAPARRRCAGRASTRCSPWSAAPGPRRR